MLEDVRDRVCGIGGEEEDGLAGMAESVMHGEGGRDRGFSDTAFSNKEVQFRHTAILANLCRRRGRRIVACPADGDAISDLQLHEEAGRLRQNGELGDLTADHGDFVAALETRTLAAVFINFVGKILAVCEGESHSVKEFRNTSKEADATDTLLA